MSGSASEAKKSTFNGEKLGMGAPGPLLFYTINPDKLHKYGRYLLILIGIVPPLRKKEIWVKTHGMRWCVIDANLGEK
jgi:hypothetical protein